MARIRFIKRKAPKNGAARSGAARTTKKPSNLARCCNEDCSLFSESNVGETLNDKSGQLPLAAPQHSKEVSPCSNAAAHQGPHYICTNCSSLADTYLRNEPHGLLRGGHPARKGQRFFLLCKTCKDEAQRSSKQGCFCFDRTSSLCFQCKSDKLAFAAAKRDAEVEYNRLAFVPWGAMVDDKWLFMRPVLNCLCGKEELEIGDGQDGIMRCAGCEGTVTKTGGQVWDPFVDEFVEVFG